MSDKPTRAGPHGADDLQPGGTRSKGSPRKLVLPQRMASVRDVHCESAGVRAGDGHTSYPFPCGMVVRVRDGISVVVGRIVREGKLSCTHADVDVVVEDLSSLRHQMQERHAYNIASLHELREQIKGLQAYAQGLEATIAAHRQVSIRQNAVVEALERILREDGLDQDLLRRTSDVDGQTPLEECCDEIRDEIHPEETTGA